jgi:hypothetical protein
VKIRNKKRQGRRRKSKGSRMKLTKKSSPVLLPLQHAVVMLLSSCRRCLHAAAAAAASSSAASIRTRTCSENTTRARPLVKCRSSKQFWFPNHLQSMALERQVAPALQMINFVSADNIYSGATFGAQMIAVERSYTGRASVPA